MNHQQHQRHLTPAYLAHVDQELADTAATVRKLAAQFRRHTAEHDGSPICSHAMAAQAFLRHSSPATMADLMASALCRIVELEDKLGEAGR